MIHLLLIPMLTWITSDLNPGPLSNQLNNSLKGVWQLKETSGEVLPGKQIKLFTDHYFAFSRYDEEPAGFHAAGGGYYQQENGKYTETYEFFTKDPDKVNEQVSYTMKLEGDEFRLMSIKNGEPYEEIWERISDDHSEMTGVWQITARKREDDTMSPMPDGPRKTIKVISGNRFQWAAINTETGEFFGTGGGTIETDEDTYTEQIVFFSRDNSKAGIALTFDKELSANETRWHHTGHGTTGKPVNEIWQKVD